MVVDFLDRLSCRHSRLVVLRGSLQSTIARLQGISKKQKVIEMVEFNLFTSHLVA